MERQNRHNDDLGILAELLPQHEPWRYKWLPNPIIINSCSKALRVFEHLLVVLQPIHLIQLGFVVESPPGREKPRFEADKFVAGFGWSSQMSKFKCLATFSFSVSETSLEELSQHDTSSPAAHTIQCTSNTLFALDNS